MPSDPPGGLPSVPQFWYEQCTRALQSMQQMFPLLAGAVQPWEAALGALGTSPAAAPAAPAAAQVSLDAEKLAQLQQEYLAAVQALGSSGGVQALLAQDKRFNTPSWCENPLAAATAASYLLTSRMLLGLAQAVQGDAKTRQRVRFATEQWLAAAAPSNFLALNAEAQKKALQTQGESLAQGMANLLADLRQGHVSMTDERQFSVGQNVATTEGAVVFENDLFQLLEYKPLTPRVHARPFLMVPPCINKYYILDLQPDNSVIRYAVAQGLRTFVVSWRNPDAELGHKTWDDYIEEGMLRAIRVVGEIADAPQINTLGFCVGGTMLAAALGVLQARHARAGKNAAPFPVACTTFLTTLIDFSDPGVLDVFIDEAAVRFREAQMGQGGIMRGQDLASTFSFLRPNDLVWNYVVGNYLKGETPPPFDLLYWNSDCTNLPGPYYAWYLRNLYLENRLVQPGALTICGERIDLGQVQVPAFIYGSREDHIVPIGGAYASTQALGGDKRFCMGASGHIAGVINPPQKKKRSHWLRTDAALPPTLAQWLEGASEHPGSWWPHWSAWLKSHSGEMVAAPGQYGKGKQYPALAAAPGSYVLVKA